MYSAEEFRQKVLTVLGNIIDFPFEERHKVNEGDIERLRQIYQNIVGLDLVDTNGISNFFSKSQILHQLLKPFYSEDPENNSPFNRLNIAIKLAIALLITESFHDADNDNDLVIRFLSRILGPGYSEEHDNSPKQLDTFLQSPNFVSWVLGEYELLTNDDEDDQDTLNTLNQDTLNWCLDGRLIVSTATLSEYFDSDSFLTMMQQISQLADNSYLIASESAGKPRLAIDVNMREIEVVHSYSNDPKVKIGTSGLANCTSCVFYGITQNGGHHFTGVAHCPDEIVPAYKQMFEQIQAQARELGTELDQSSIVIHLVGGMISSMGAIVRMLLLAIEQGISIGVFMCVSNVADGELGIELLPDRTIAIYLNRIYPLSDERQMHFGFEGAVPPPPMLFAASPAVVGDPPNAASGSRLPPFDFALPGLSSDEEEEEGPGRESPPPQRLRLGE